MILIIGGSGFVGTRLNDICNRAFTVYNLDRRQSYFFPEITTIGDIRNVKDIANGIKKVK